MGAMPVDILAVEMKLLCSECGTKLRVDVRYEGSEWPCPTCEKPARVPVWLNLWVPPPPPSLSPSTPDSVPASEIVGEPQVLLTPEEISFLGEIPENR